MKLIQIKFLKVYNILIVGLLFLLGFALSCKRPKSEYGTPSAKFIVNGKVTSADLNDEIKEIEVDIQGDNAVTDNEGKYQVIVDYAFPKDQTFSIKFKDVDGEANGSFEDLDTIVEFKDPQFVNGDGHWYEGEISKEFNVKLQKKK